VNDFLVGGGTDAPEEEEDEDEVEPSRPSVTYDDMWAKTLLDASDEVGQMRKTLLGNKLHLLCSWCICSVGLQRG
jgi:hypothetical protein